VEGIAFISRPADEATGISIEVKIMARIVTQTKTAAVNPLKSSQPLGAALAFLGIDGALPILHGSQGCANFALVLLVRHFKQMVPLQTTAMDEIGTVVGGPDLLERAVIKLGARSRPRLIGICTTAVAETRDEDISGDIFNFKGARERELIDTEVVLARTPDFAGSVEEGWSTAVTAMIEAITRRGVQDRDPTKIVILPGSNTTVADVEYLRETVESFGLTPLILPDVSGGSYETVGDQWNLNARGGAKMEHIRDLGAATQCIAVGEQMRRPAETLQGLTGIPYVMFGSLTGLNNADRLAWLLTAISGDNAPTTVRRDRMRLQEAMLSGHFHLAGKKIAIGCEPDQLFQLAQFFVGMGATITAAVTTTGDSKVLQIVPTDTVKVGDLGDLEQLAADADLLVTHSHGRQAAERLAVPLMRVGFPVFDRIGSQHKLNILYRGTRDMIYDIANIVQASNELPPARADPVSTG
jgi:nitrogenase molybdenum-iron protein NifN